MSAAGAQSRLESLLEATVSVAIGFVVSYLFWRWVVVPLYDMQVSERQNLEITALFTVLSISRSYLMRRFFNAGLHRAVQKIARRWVDG